MTEAEWLNSTDPTPMLAFLQGKASERKLVLFACTCLRGLRGIPAEEWYWDGIETVELQTPLWPTLLEMTRAIKERLVMNQDFETASTVRDIERAMGGNYEGCEKAKRVAQRTISHSRECNPHQQQHLSVMFRDIFGNPFRPLTADPSWLTFTVGALARQMYETRDFSSMPILADALQDAGCYNADILTHCRGEGPHVRGCWVVDKLLGKE